MIRRCLALLAVVAVGLVVAVAGAEIAARIATGISLDDAARERADLLASIPGADGGEAADVLRGDGAAEARRALGAQYDLHPFLGYTFAPGKGGANAQGFLSGVGDFPYRKGPRELVIGLFGGSVAMQVAASPEALLEPLRRGLAARGWDRVTLISFATGGWRQPQSFIALVQHLPMLDVAIFLDGHNEVLHLADEELADYPAAWPWRPVWGLLATRGWSSEEVLRVADLLRAHADAAQATRTVSETALRHSMLAHLAWRALARRYETRVAELREAAVGSTRDEWAGIDPPAADGGFAAKRDAYLALYEDVVRNAHLAAAAKGKPLFHFVQPNQYLRGAKPLSDEEKRWYVRRRERFDLITPLYGRLEEASGRLRAAGVESHFMGRVFAALPETAYSDDCCHLSRRGLEVLEAAIAERILESGRLDAPPP